ncbi:carboxypeptidase-like regulatory domain-containing protein [Rhizosphaericola mali]|uniref:TonB-dependent receptor n=1 Tax=Rhizosphaericola mali TaxID=2545455 RepID=A0A5P2G2U8_9BACT|nr:carboxypeptidase-like regulatory domain-containing protein [Rhizosphaericola mali]QES88439.1 TonB-dependent receptor [Rhizosphaericola mali]
MRKYLFTLFLISIFSFYTSSTYAQQIEENTTKITGQILSNDSIPQEMIPIFLKEIKKGTLTNNDGFYSFDNIQPGKYTLRIQILDAVEKDTVLTVQPGENLVFNYRLTKENIALLQEVRVLSRNNKFSRKESPYVARMPLKYLENPQVYNSVSKELITEQMAMDLGSVAKNIPGAGIPMIANQGRVTFRSRGFDTEPNARNGVAGAAFSFLDNCNLERLEAIKGPSATLFGSNIASSYGGVYNRVTKKPYNGKGGEVSYTGGSWNFNRMTIDYNSPINADKTALFRLNAATTFEKSFQDNGFTNSLAIAPSFFYQLSDKLSLTIDMEFGQAKGTSVVRFNPSVKTPKNESILDMQFPYRKTFLGDDVPYTTQMMNIFAQANYKISSTWTSQTIVSRTRSTINGYITALAGQPGDTTIKVNVIAGNTNFMATNLQQNFIGDFLIGRFRNRVVLGLDYYNNSNSFDRTTVNSANVNFINPPSTFRFTKFQIDSLTTKGTPRKESNADNTYAAYVSDVFNITDRLLVMGSLRINRFQSAGTYNILTGQTTGGLSNNGLTVGPYGQTALSHKEGIVYEVVKNRVSLFANYMNAFFSASGVDKNGNQFVPEHGNQFEYGVKADIWEHKLVGTASIYNINIKDVLRPDPEDYNYNIQDGTERSKGFELDITANPINGLNIVAGYAYNNLLMTKSDSLTQGLRPSASGPSKTFNFWGSYHFTSGPLSGFGFGFGCNTGNTSFQTNTRVQTTNGLELVRVSLPSYVICDATIYYEQPKFRIGLKVDNLTSEKAWSVRLTPQPPARFLGSIALKF